MDEDPDYPICDWAYELANGATRLSYEEWLIGRYMMFDVDQAQDLVSDDRPTWPSLA